MAVAGPGPGGADADLYAGLFPVLLHYSRTNRAHYRRHGLQRILYLQCGCSFAGAGRTGQQDDARLAAVFGNFFSRRVYLLLEFLVAALRKFSGAAADSLVDVAERICHDFKPLSVWERGAEKPCPLIQSLCSFDPEAEEDGPLPML